MLRIYLLGALIVTFVFAVVIAFAQDQRPSFGRAVSMVAIQQCSVNDEVIATLSQRVKAGEPTDFFSVETILTPGIEYFNADVSNVRERFSTLCLEVLIGGKLIQMKE